MANQTGLGSSPGVSTQFGQVPVAASQISTQSNLGCGLSPAQVAVFTTVSYSQNEPGLKVNANGPVRS
jgi:hypothetical protein